ncbi:hypothetical protein APS_1732 [Acetobacter pasteurianus subsp. pasteurianus LMG 1262 = NBRC 106471]|nr:hypothetical protein APS_1732 [Acetobacter pasteurianus subsp. pasteurianus LMG 1262 = NBRC 106471]
MRFYWSFRKYLNIRKLMPLLRTIYYELFTYRRRFITHGNERQTGR